MWQLVDKTFNFLVSEWAGCPQCHQRNAGVFTHSR